MIICDELRKNLVDIIPPWTKHRLKMSASIGKDHPPSLSTISETTVNSSVVARQNDGNFTFYEDFEEDMFGRVHDLDKKKVRVGQLGDVNHIYHFYTPPNNESKSKFDNKK